MHKSPILTATNEDGDERNPNKAQLMNNPDELREF
jgi:hypothetical protein